MYMSNFFYEIVCKTRKKIVWNVDKRRPPDNKTFWRKQLLKTSLELIKVSVNAFQKRTCVEQIFVHAF